MINKPLYFLMTVFIHLYRLFTVILTTIFLLFTTTIYADEQNNNSPRSNLTKSQLFSEKNFSQPLNMQVFKASDKQILTQEKPLSGKITLSAIPRLSAISSVVGKITNDNVSMVRAIMPTMSFDFIQSNNNIIPLQRTLRSTRHPSWDYIVGLGKIWQEASDSAFYRVAIPFSLIEKNQNCVHNGALSFLINEQGKTSNFYYQISSETCLYFKANFWGMGKVVYENKNISNHKQVLKWYKNEQKNRLPTKSMVKLEEYAATKNVNINLNKIALKAEINPSNMTVYGVVSDNIHYASTCNTRTGAYPFCNEMVLPSYSTAKSLFAGIAMLRMEKLYPGIFNELVSDWVPACKNNWQGVTFSHLLNMSTGHYISKKSNVDEAAEHGLIFFGARSHQEKINYSCTQFPPQEKPGEQFVYHTSDTYLLGTALNNFLKAKQGENADIFNDVLVKDIWPAAKFSPVTYRSRRTLDKRKQPFSGFGLFYLRDDIAKFNLFLSTQLALPENESLLDRTQLKNTLQKNDRPAGLLAGYSFLRYSNGFWARKVSDILSCETETWLPVMSGYGGISIVLLPDNRQFYYVSDSGKFTWRNAIAELHKIKPICQ